MTRQLILVRHGASALPASRGLMDRPAVERWLVEYDDAGIRADSRPSERLRRLAAAATHVVASDLVRARESAGHLAGDREVLTSPLLREVPLHIPRSPVRLPHLGWGALIHLAWMLDGGTRRTLGREEEVRVADGVRWLAELVPARSCLVAVTHGVFRTFAASRLLAGGWKQQGRHGGFMPWSYWVFSEGTRSGFETGGLSS